MLNMRCRTQTNVAVVVLLFNNEDSSFCNVDLGCVVCAKICFTASSGSCIFLDSWFAVFVSQHFQAALGFLCA